MIPVCWVVLEGVEVVFCEEILHFFGVFICVYDYDSFAFVGPRNHCLIRCKLVIYAFYDVARNTTNTSNKLRVVYNYIILYHIY